MRIGFLRLASSFGKYQLIATLGRGGMADVYLALMSGAIGFRKLVVVKKLRQDVADRGDLESMLLGEAQLAAHLQHPNVVQTFEVGLHEGHHYIAMEYLEGQPIANLVRTGGRMPASVAAQIMADALAGLSYAHTLADYDGKPLAIVHRDVSPQNLFVTYGGEVKVVDFGVAKTALHVPAETQTGVLKGKLGYMAPEQLHGLEVDARTDIFASGIVLWEMLTGKRLFRTGAGDGPTQAIAKMLFATIPRPTEIVPDLPLPLEAIVMRALERDVTRRWPTAAAMREALYGFLEGSGRPTRRDAIGEYVLGLFASERDAMKAKVTATIAEAESSTALVPMSQLETLSEQHRKNTSAPPPSITARLPPTPSGPAGIPSQPVPFASAPPPPPPVVTEPPRSRRPWIFILAGGIATFVGTSWLLRRPPSPAPTPAAVDAAVPVARPAPILVIEGSGTIGVQAAPLFVEGFLGKRGVGGIRREAGTRPGEILVVGTGANGIEESILIRNEATKEGFAGLADRKCDIAMAAREIRDRESSDLAARGLGDIRLAGEHVIGLDGIAVVVNSSNPVNALDRDRLADIYSGATQSWSDVGGNAAPVALYAHQDGAGTFDVFSEIVLRGKSIAATTKRLPDNDVIASTVVNDPNGIGFVGLAFAGSAKPLALYDRGVQPMLPSAFTVTTERYLLTRRFYLYTPVPPKPAASELVDWTLSEAGQAMIRKAGFVDLGITMKSAEPCDRCPPRYAKVTRNARRLSLDFRFRGTTNVLDARAREDVDRVVGFLRDHPAEKILLLGFVDASGDAKADVRRSKELAQAVDGALQTRGLRASVVDGYGGELAIAGNATEWGRTKNRRVEIWVVEDR